MVTMGTTLQDIANELNLSAQTVSRSLRHDTGINPATRARVHETARRLGYQGRPGRPRRVREEGGSVKSLCLLVRHISLDVLPGDNNLMKMMAGIMAVADEHGVHLKVHPVQPGVTTTMEEDPSLIPPVVRENMCQAVIAHGEQDEKNLDFLSHRLPVVSMGRLYRNLHMDAAVADNIEGIGTLVTYLVNQGHEKVAWVGAPYRATFVSAREAGFIQACRTLGLEIGPHTFVPDDAGSDNESWRAALQQFVEAGVTAFACVNDGIAWRVVRALEMAGIEVPGDVAVTGFDASQNLSSTRHLTSFDPNFVEIGKAAAHMALQRANNLRHEPRIVSVRGSLVVGDTTAPPRHLQRAEASEAEKLQLPEVLWAQT